MSKTETKSVALCMSLKSFTKEGGVKGITRDDIARQDISFLYARNHKMVERMKDHPGRNRDYNPDAKTISIAQVPDIVLKRGISRQVNRQIDRLQAKADKRHKRHRYVNYVMLTHVYTGRYTSHIGSRQVPSLGME